MQIIQNITFIYQTLKKLHAVQLNRRVYFVFFLEQKSLSLFYGCFFVFSNV